mgnify:CR=1 FL=1
MKFALRQVVVSQCDISNRRQRRHIHSFLRNEFHILHIMQNISHTVRCISQFIEDKLFHYKKTHPYRVRFLESVKILLRSILTEKPLLTQWACSLLQRIICLRNADKFHVWRLKSIFRHAHVATKNKLNFVSSLRTKFCEAFLTIWTETASEYPMLFLLSLEVS